MKTTLLAAPTLGSGRTASLAAMRRRLRLWLDLWSERRMLQTLDDRQLADLGLCRGDVEREGSRYPWDLPPGRLW